MKVSLTIPAWNEEQYIRACLESVFAQTEQPDEVIVVDNNCTDRTVEIVKEFPSVRVVKEKTPGASFSRNAGFNAATGDLICRTDADTRLRPNWIAHIKRYMTAHPDVIGLSGPAQFYDIPKILRLREWPANVVLLSVKSMLGHDVMFGPNIAMRKEAWQKIKNEVCTNDRLVHEDIDLSIHLAKYGKIKFDTKLIVDSSPRRWKKLMPYIEYPYRYITTVQQHMNLPAHLKLKPMNLKPIKIKPRVKSVKSKLHSGLLAFKQLNPF